MLESTAETKRDSTFVTDRLRAAITSGELAPNQRLVEADLMEAYGASRGAVRLAIVNLTAEGLVERIQNRSARVRAVDLDEALEIVEIRAAVESLCAGRAATQADESGRDRLRRIGDDMRAAVESGDTERYSDGNRRLHHLILELSGMKVAPDIVDRLRAQGIRHHIRLARQHDRPATSLPEHLAIIDAICDGDPEAATEAMRRHLISVKEATRKYSG